MTNPVHLPVTPMKARGSGEMMQALVGVYYVNKTCRRTGTLWEGRYKASLIESDPYLLTGKHYIELHPVRARMVTHLGEYAWSSAGSNAQGGGPMHCSRPIPCARR